MAATPGTQTPRRPPPPPPPVCAPAALQGPPMSAPAPKIGFVSLGCPKALVDSERILTLLTGEGYATSQTHEGADAVVVNTCGFLDSAREEIGRASCRERV